LRAESRAASDFGICEAGAARQDGTCGTTFDDLLCIQGSFTRSLMLWYVPTAVAEACCLGVVPSEGGVPASFDPFTLTILFPCPVASLGSSARHVRRRVYIEYCRRGAEVGPRYVLRRDAERVEDQQTRMKLTMLPPSLILLPLAHNHPCFSSAHLA
jgi:hypothetical protein